MKSKVPRQAKGKEKKPEPESPRQGAAASPKAHSPTPALSPCDDLHIVIAKRAYELYIERGYRQGTALDDWLQAEREVLTQIPPAERGPAV